MAKNELLDYDPAVAHEEVECLADAVNRYGAAGFRPDIVIEEAEELGGVSVPSGYEQCQDGIADLVPTRRT